MVSCLRGPAASKGAKELVDGLGEGYNITHRYKKPPRDQLYLQVWIKESDEPSISADYDDEEWEAAASAVCQCFECQWKDTVSA